MTKQVLGEVNMNQVKKLKPVFIGGSQRNGTTLLGSLLGTSVESVVTPESQFVVDLWKDAFRSNQEILSKQLIFKRLKKNFRFHLWESPIPNISNYKEEMFSSKEYVAFLNDLIQLYALKTNQENSTHWIDHTPTHIQYGLILSKLFPESKFIHLIRDPRAVAASIIDRDWGPNNVKDASKLWAESIGYGCALQQSIPDRVLVIYYEDLLLSTEPVLKEVCDFIGIEYASNMLGGTGFKLPEYTKEQHDLVGKSIDSSRIDGWKEKLTASEIYEIEDRLLSLMTIHGYEVCQEAKPSKESIKEILTKEIRKFKKNIDRFLTKKKKKRYKKQLANEARKRF